MKIFITGATGFVGSHLARRCVQDRHEVHLLLRAASDPWRIRDVLANAKIHTADLTDAVALKTIVNAIHPDVIFHLATHSIYGAHPVVGQDTEIIRMNFLATRALMDTLNDIPYSCFINTGSSSEYGAKQFSMKETDACEPLNVYGVAKCAATLYGQYLAKTQKKPIITLRLFSPFGQYDDAKRLIPHAIREALGNHQLSLGNPRAARDYVFIDDVIDAYMHAFRNVRTSAGEIFNIGSGEQQTIKNIVSTVLRVMGSASSVSWGAKTMPVWDSEYWQADIAKAETMLGWKPKHTFEEGIEKTIAWFRENMHYYKI